MGRSGRAFDKIAFELLQVPFPPYSCKRCEYTFEYPQDAPLNHIIQLVYGHQKLCFSGTRLPPSKEVTNANENNPAESGDVSRTATKRIRTTQQAPLESEKRKKKNVMDEKTRRQLIERDLWGRNATSKSVECRGCGKTIKLDKRSQYYPGLWHKHRSKCPEIRRLAAQGRKATNNLREACNGGGQPLNRESSLVSSVETTSGTNATRERVLRWTATLGPRYDAVPSQADIPEPLALKKSDGDNGENMIPRIQRPVYVFNSTTTTTTSNGGQNSDEERHWGSLELGGDNDSEATQSPEEPEQRQRMHRCSTRAEPVKHYKDNTLRDKQGVAVSEDVIQAALCLVSMKSRAPMS